MPIFFGGLGGLTPGLLVVGAAAIGGAVVLSQMMDICNHQMQKGQTRSPHYVLYNNENRAAVKIGMKVMLLCQNEDGLDIF